MRDGGQKIHKWQNEKNEEYSRLRLELHPRFALAFACMKKFL